MATQENLELTQKLYLAYYGRPADPGGLAFWAELLEENNGNLDAIMDAFGTSDEFDSRFGDFSNEELINNLYQQIFGRSADEKGKAFFVPLLNEGSISLAEIATSIVNGAQNDDVTIINNRVAVANKITQEVEERGLEYGSEQIEAAGQLVANVAADTNVNEYIQSVAVNQFLVEPPTEPEPLRLELPLGDGWTAGNNNINFELVFPSAASLEDVSLQGGGALSISASSTSIGGETTVNYSISAANGVENGTLELSFAVSDADAENFTFQMQGLVVNGESLDDTDYAIEGDRLIMLEPPTEPALEPPTEPALEPPTEPIFFDFMIIDESSVEDTTGYDTNYNNIADVLTLPNVKIGLIENSAITNAHLHIDEGESFLFDHDTFELRADEDAVYRIKITPDNLGVFQGNIIADTYKEDGSRADGVIMNLIGYSNSFVDGALYSDVFSMTADMSKYMSLSMRWRGEAGETANGPEPYQVELIAAGEPSFDIVQETYEEDTVGYDLGLFENIVDNLFTLPDAKIALIEATASTQAYLHIDEGESYLSDHDTFEIRADKDAYYRIKITPDNPGVFQSNITANTYKEDGSSADGLIMNLIGDSNSFVDGALYSDVFSMAADTSKYMSLSMGWRGEVGETANGPEPYQVELVEVGTMENSSNNVLF